MRGSARTSLTISARRACDDAADDPLAGDDRVGQELLGDLATADDRAERPAVGLGQVHGARVGDEQAHRVLGDPVEDGRRVERRRDLATDVGERGHLVGAAVALAEQPRVLDRAPTLAAIVVRSRTSAAPNRPSWLVLWTLIDADRLVADAGSARRGTTSPAFRRRGCRSASKSRARLSSSGSRVVEDPRRQAAAERQSAPAGRCAPSSM